MPWPRRLRRPPPAGGVTRPDVYPAGGFSVATGSLTDTFRPLPTGPGDLLILFLGDASSNTINAVSVTDTKGNKWVRGPFIASGSTNLPTSAWIATRSIALSGTDVITVTWDTATSFGKSAALCGVNSQIIPNPGADLVASAAANGASASVSVTSGTPNYPAEFAVACINTGFAGWVINLTGANTSAGLVQHNDATNWLQPCWQPVQPGGSAVSVTANIGSVSWSALVVMVGANMQVAPVYPLQRPVAARTPAEPRTAAGWTAARAGPYGGTGPAVRPLDGPVKGQPAYPLLTGRTESRRGPYGQLGPKVRQLPGPVHAVRPPPAPAAGRVQHAAGAYGQLGAAFYPLRHPHAGQPQKPVLTGRARGRAGTYTAVVTAPSVGVLTAGDTAVSAVTASGTTAALTAAAATSALGTGGTTNTLTASDIRTGGPGG